MREEMKVIISIAFVIITLVCVLWFYLWSDFRVVSCGMRYQELSNGKVAYEMFGLRNNGWKTKVVYSGIADKKDLDALFDWYEYQFHPK